MVYDCERGKIYYRLIQPRLVVAMTDCCKKSKYSFLDCDDKLQKEVWRFRLNWLYTTVAAVLLSISEIAVSSSFHQFVTNPRSNSNGTLSEFEFGLGQSESFYSWLLATYNIGAGVGAVSSGFLVRCFPYWYLYMFSLLTHIVGYTICAITYEDWLLMISMFLSGYFIGAEMTLAYSYASESSVEYVELMRKRKKKVEEGTGLRVKSYLFSLQSVGYLCGNFLGPAAAVIFAQFQIKQFQSTAWLNVAIGIAVLILQFITFHGESSCKKITQCRDVCQCNRGPSNVETSPFQIFIILSFILLRAVASSRFGVYETLLNPVLSDTFGLTEKYTSYFFLGTLFARLLGVITLFLMQKLKTSSQLMTIIGILITLIACVLIADWQAIPYDPCTEYSPFHHPEITQNYSGKQQLNETSEHYYNTTTRIQAEHIETFMLTELYLHSNIEIELADGSIFNIKTPVDMKFTCKHVNECECSQQSAARNCLHYTLHNGANIRHEKPSWVTQRGHERYPELFLCAMSTTPMLSPLSTCVHLYSSDYDNSTSTQVEEVLQPSSTIGSIQSLLVLPNDSYYIAKNNCINANDTNRQCHWTPSSIITNKECEDCQPICRSREQSLTFIQFILGITLILASVDMLWVHVAVLTTNHVPMRFQGIVMGALTASCTIGWSISPLFLDAAYEAVQKRTFLPMIILGGLHLPFLIEIIVLYRKLGPQTVSHSGYSRIDVPKIPDTTDCCTDDENIENGVH